MIVTSKCSKYVGYSQSSLFRTLESLCYVNSSQRQWHQWENVKLIQTWELIHNLNLKII